MAGTTGTARQEAERLVATVLAMAAQSGLGGNPRDRDPSEPEPSGLGNMLNGLVGQFMGGSSHHSQPGPGGTGWSTGSAECCVCPICRAIATMRNPSPEQAERLATGAGDF